MVPFPVGSVGGNFLWQKKHRDNNKGEQQSKPKKTDKQTGTTVGRPDVEVIGLSLRKLLRFANHLSFFFSHETRLSTFELQCCCSFFIFFTPHTVVNVPAQT